MRDAVAQAIGGMSGRTYEKAKVVVAAAKADPEKFAPPESSPWGTVSQVKRLS